jgi:hypothetical protein
MRKIIQICVLPKKNEDAEHIDPEVFALCDDGLVFTNLGGSHWYPLNDIPQGDPDDLDSQP